jgi:2-hydroxychromene-2-carboxylate isomerase
MGAIVWHLIQQESRMSATIDYFFAPNSPWTFLGHQRLAVLAQAHSAQVRVMPVDLGQVFSVSGGLPLPKRAPQRQAYRLVELRRFAQHLNVPLNPEPAHFPVAGDPAAKLIVATDAQEGWATAMRLTGAIGAAVWVQERNIADEATLVQLLDECGLPESLLALSQTDDVQARYAANTQAAMDAGVFGAPTYGVEGELFWGQDRLDFLARRLAA